MGRGSVLARQRTVLDARRLIGCAESDRFLLWGTGAPVPIRRRVRRRMKHRAAHSSSRGASPAQSFGACAREWRVVSRDEWGVVGLGSAANSPRGHSRIPPSCARASEPSAALRVLGVASRYACGRAPCAELRFLALALRRNPVMASRRSAAQWLRRIGPALRASPILRAPWPRVCGTRRAKTDPRPIPSRPASMKVQMCVSL